MATKVKEKDGKITIRKKRLYTQHKEVIGKPVKGFLDRLKLRQADAFLRDNMFGHEIIWGGIKHQFTPAQVRKKTYKYFYIFAMVKKDALKFLKTHKVKKTGWLPSIHYNKNIKLGKRRIAGVDLDTAYWDMALRLGVVSENTFDKGIMIPDKALGLAALSSLGKDRTYSVIRKGELTNDKIIVPGSDKLKEVYRLIRLTCFKFMQRLARKLGSSDYVAYRTDCLYYVDNQRNNRIVREFMEKHRLDFKIAKEAYNPQNLSQDAIGTV